MVRFMETHFDTMTNAEKADAEEACIIPDTEAKLREYFKDFSTAEPPGFAPLGQSQKIAILE